MKKELEQKLAAEFPFMRRDPAALTTRPVIGLYSAFGCEHGDGWYELLRSMCAEIVGVYKDLGVEVGFTPTQVKEKYGTLHVYYNSNADTNGKIREIVEKYEEKSETICEVCGEPGSLRNDLSWIRTLCNTHYKEALNITHEDRVKALESVGLGAWLLNDIKSEDEDEPTT